MNLLLFSNEDRVAPDRVAPDRVALATARSRPLITVSGRRAQHLQQVLGAVPGDSIRVGEIGGLTGDGELLSLGSRGATLAVDLHTEPPPKLPLSLVMALPRPKMLRRILRSAAELGVRDIHLIHSARVEKSFWQTPVLEPTVVRDYLLLGLEQSRDTILPSVVCHRRFKPFAEDLLPTLTANQQALLAHPGNHRTCPRDLGSGTVLIVGPEGGFIPYEVDKLQQAGCVTVSLGPRILRVETAIVALVGRLA